MVRHNAFFLILCTFILSNQVVSAKRLKVMHLTFHKGCIRDFEYVAQQLDLELTSIAIFDQPEHWLDGETGGSARYNISHQRAQKAWRKHKDYFNQFDVIITSDTTPLSRIFLQSKWKKPLIIWICNRFDYYDEAARDGNFPDTEYYQLIQEASNKKNVQIIAYTPFEHYYAKLKGVNTGKLLIKPCAKPNNFLETSLIPSYINRSETFFIPPYHNDTIFCDLKTICTTHGIPVYNGRYEGPGDLKEFKGIIHIPYAWSNLALFENIQNGIPYFIPSKKFILELQQYPNFFFMMLDQNTIDYSEWYAPEHKDLFIYFDSWADLAVKINQTNFDDHKKKLLDFAQKHHDSTMAQWRAIFSPLYNLK